MIFILIIIVIFIFELCLKNKIEHAQEETFPKYYWKNRIIIERFYNKGAFLNVGEKSSKIVTFLSCAIVIYVTIIFAITVFQKGKSLLKLGMALLLGGGYSNTYDRIKRKHVVDYISFKRSKSNDSKVVYNISDFFIAIGVILVYIYKKIT